MYIYTTLVPSMAEWQNIPLFCQGRYQSAVVYMVQYAIIQYFDQKLQKTENFYLATIFKVKHRMSSYISTFFRKRMSVSMGIIPGQKDV